MDAKSLTPPPAAGTEAKGNRPEPPSLPPPPELKPPMPQ
jgi:hypothetical protein